MNNKNNNNKKRIRKVKKVTISTYAKQKEIIDSWFNPYYKYVLAVCGRQVGKSFAARLCALMTAIKPIYKEDNAKIAYFLPTGASAGTQFESLTALIDDNKIPEVININKSKKELKFSNGSSILFLSAEISSANGLRGKTFDYIIIDEACFIDDEMITTIIFPMISVAFGKGRGKVLMITTADGKNIFYKLFTSSDENTKKITFTSYDSPLSSKEYLDRQRELMPDEEFRREYLAEFIDGLNSFFKTSVYKYNDNFKYNDRGAVAGIDWAITNDFTVLSIINKNRELIAYYRYQNTDYTTVIDEMVSILSKYGYPEVYSEQNGIGAVPTQLLKDKYKGTVNSFVTTNKSKNDILTKMHSDLISSDKPLVLVKDEILINEMNNFGKEVSSSGVVRYSNIDNSTHDDIIMSIAIANYHLKEYQEYGTYNRIRRIK